jgi:hypothetical protein
LYPACTYGLYEGTTSYLVPSFEKKYFHDVFGLNVSTGCLTKQIRNVSQALQEPYEELLKQLFDELHWIWALRALMFSVFKIAPFRGSCVLEELSGKDFKGILSGDFFSAYRKFQNTAGIVAQFCWAHLICEILFVSEKQDKLISNDGKRLLRYVKAMFETIHQKERLLKRTWHRLMKEHRRIFLRQCNAACR